MLRILFSLLCVKCTLLWFYRSVRLEGINKYAKKVLRQLWNALTSQISLFATRTERPLNFIWTKEPLKVLGVYISYDKVGNERKNDSQEIENLNAKLGTWRSRYFLSLALFNREVSWDFTDRSLCCHARHSQGLQCKNSIFYL